MRNHLRIATRYVGAGALLAGLLSPAFAGATPITPTNLIGFTHTADQTVVLPGTTVTYSMSVTNPKDTPLSRVSVVSTGCAKVSYLSGDTNHNNKIERSETWNYGCSAPVNVDTTATATVTASSGDDEDEDEHDNDNKDKKRTNGEFTSDAITSSLSVAIPVAIDVVHPSIHVEKYAPKRLIEGGGTAQFTISVRNDGDVKLTGVTLTDALAPDCSRSAGSVSADGNLDPKEQVDYECEMPIAQSGVTNVVVASGQPPVGPAVTAQDSEEIDVVNPLIDIEMFTFNRTARVGDLITYTISVKNLSTATIAADGALTDVEVTDALVPSCNRSIGTMAAGDRVDYECSAPAGSEDFINIAAVTGKTKVGTVVGDDDPEDVDVIHPALAVAIATPLPVARVGAVVTYTVTVRNIGDTPLSAISTASAAPECALSAGTIPADGTLDAGEEASFTCTSVAPQDDAVLTVSASGQPLVGPRVGASADKAIDVIHPVIAISVAAKSPNAQGMFPAPFNVTVTNTGDSPLDGVTTSSSNSPDCARKLGALAVGESKTFSCVSAALPPEGLFTLLAEASGQPLAGDPVKANASGSVTAVLPPANPVSTPTVPATPAPAAPAAAPAAAAAAPVTTTPATTPSTTVPAPAAVEVLGVQVAADRPAVVEEPSLAYTGSHGRSTTVLGLGLVIGGAVLVFASRRRPARDAGR